jgi:hypothetical protein
MNGLLLSIENKARASCAPDPPPEDPARIDIDHEGNIDEPLPRCDIGEVADPQYVRRRRVELAVHPIQGARQCLVRDRGFGLLAANDPLDPDVLHQAGDRASCNIKTLAPHLVSYFADAIDAEIFLKHTLDLGLEVDITLRTI